MVWVEEKYWGFGINNLLLCLLFFLHSKLNIIDPFWATWLLFLFCFVLFFYFYFCFVFSCCGLLVVGVVVADGRGSCGWL